MKDVFDGFQRSFLFEANETFDVKLRQIRKRLPDYDERLFYRLIDIDPTTNKEKRIVGKYIDWLVRKVTDLQQVDSIRVPLEWYADGIKKNILQKQYGVSPDINSFKSVDEFINTMREIIKGGEDENIQSESEYNARKKYEGQFIVRGESKYWEIISPTTWEAERYFGRHTEWCTVGDEHYFKSYGGPEGKLNILYPKFVSMKNESDYEKRVQFDFYKNTDRPFFNTKDKSFECVYDALCDSDNGLEDVYVKDAVELVNRIFNRKEIFSEKIGTVYEKDGKRGIVAAVDENDNPTLLMGLEDALVPDENGEGCSWGDAMKLKPENGWRVGTKEDWEQVKPNWKQLVRNVKKNLNQDLMMTDDQEWYKWYWTSTEYSSTTAWGFNTYYGGGLDYRFKDYSNEYYRVCCFCET